jgi:hypothetical protein
MKMMAQTLGDSSPSVVNIGFIVLMKVIGLNIMMS